MRKTNQVGLLRLVVVLEGVTRVVSWEISGWIFPEISGKNNGIFPEKFGGNFPTICDIKMSWNMARNVHSITQSAK